MDVRDLSLTIIFASLYSVMVIVLAPISYGPVQLRVADCLIPLAALFGWPVVVGVTVGCFLSNAYIWLGAYDVFLGPIANFIAAVVILLLRKHRLLACVVGALPIGAIVGGYLWLFFPPPDIFGLNLPAWTAMIVSITISSWIAIAVIGYSLLILLSRPRIIEPLESRGLKVTTES
ncbi:MAG: QueT transporter family protein [Candidatus Bathyarchaeota archaeon]|nr:MAG: QueT transporter family protein [Candidatus Bathyarchaeota archaeon]